MRGQEFGMRPVVGRWGFYLGCLVLGVTAGVTFQVESELARGVSQAVFVLVALAGAVYLRARHRRLHSPIGTSAEAQHLSGPLASLARALWPRRYLTLAGLVAVIVVPGVFLVAVNPAGVWDDPWPVWVALAWPTAPAFLLLAWVLILITPPPPGIVRQTHEGAVDRPGRDEVLCQPGKGWGLL